MIYEMEIVTGIKNDGKYLVGTKMDREQRVELGEIRPTYLL